MPDTADRYALPLIHTGQAQKDVTHNDAVQRIDALLHLAVDGVRTTPPPAPIAGQSWIVGTAATGAWLGLDNRIAAFTSAGWLQTVPAEGCLAWLKDAGVFSVYFGGAWHAEAWPARALKIGGRTVLGSAPATVASPAGGATIDTEARATLAQLITSLRAAGLIATG